MIDIVTNDKINLFLIFTSFFPLLYLNIYLPHVATQKKQYNTNAILFFNPIVLLREPLIIYYAGFGASVGHTSAQAPHSIHSSALIT